MKTKKIFRFALLFVLVCFGGLKMTQAKTSANQETTYLEAHKRLLLTFNEYRGLRPDQQAEYIKILSEFIAAIESQGHLQASQEFSFLKEFYAQLIKNSSANVLALAFGPSAIAASDPALVVKPTANNTCPEGYTGDGGFGNCVLISIASNNGTCKAGERAHPQKNSLGKTMCYSEAFYNSWNAKQTAANASAASTAENRPIRVVGGAAPEYAQPSSRGISNLPKSPPTDPPAKPEEEIFHPMTATPIETVPGIAPENSPAAPPVVTAIDGKGSVVTVDAKKPLICIYAGFPIRGEAKPETKCSSVSSYINEKETDGKKTAYTCLSVDDFKKTDGADKATDIVSVAKPNAKKKVLCNPMLFGLDIGTEPAQPFCISAASNATQVCRDLSAKAQAKNSAEFLKKRSQAILQNPKFFEETKYTLEHLCTGSFDADLRKTLEDRGRPVESSLQDIKSTCRIYQQRIAENGWFTGQQGRGKRTSGNR